MKELNSFTKKVAHIQHVEYIEYQSPDLLFGELNKMAWDENMYVRRLQYLRIAR